VVRVPEALPRRDPGFIDPVHGAIRSDTSVRQRLASLDTAASYLQETFGVKAVTLGIPIGIGETDRFFGALEEMSGAAKPKKYEKERGRLVDAYIDGHKYVSGKRAIVYGEADFVASVAAFLDEIGIVPALCATGASIKKFKEIVSSGFVGRA